MLESYRPPRLRAGGFPDGQGAQGFKFFVVQRRQVGCFQFPAQLPVQEQANRGKAAVSLNDDIFVAVRLHPERLMSEKAVGLNGEGQFVNGHVFPYRLQDVVLRGKSAPAGKRQLNQAGVSRVQEQLLGRDEFNFFLFGHILSGNGKTRGIMP